MENHSGYQQPTVINRLKMAWETLYHPANSFNHYYTKWSRINGWLSAKQGRWLFETALSTQLKGDIVEIGSAFGRSTVCLGLGTQLSKGGIVYSIDPHYGGKGFRENLTNPQEFNSFKEFEQNVERFGLTQIIKPIVATSEDAFKTWSPSPIRILFVDGWHTYDAVKFDATEWGKHVVPNGYIAFHDYQVPEIKEAIHDSMKILGAKSTNFHDLDGQFVYFTL
jgi:MMP 1-O-methyltransferase